MEHSKNSNLIHRAFFRRGEDRRKKSPVNEVGIVVPHFCAPMYYPLFLPRVLFHSHMVSNVILVNRLVLVDYRENTEPQNFVS